MDGSPRRCPAGHRLRWWCAALWLVGATLEDCGLQVTREQGHLIVTQHTGVEARHRWWDGRQELPQEARVSQLT